MKHNEIPIEYETWRKLATSALDEAGYHKEALAFRSCSKEFRVQICADHIDHPAKIIPYTCHLRYCPECESMESARKLDKYCNAIEEVLKKIHKTSYSLKHLCLTTPFALSSPNAESEYDTAWKWCTEAVQSILYQSLDNKGKLTDEEKRRQRLDYTKHNIGMLIAAEYGHAGHKLHFHILMYSPYTAMKEIIAPTWKRITGGLAEIAFIKAIADAPKAIRELTKYITKFDALEPSLVPKIAAVLRGRRRFESYGIWHGLPEQKSDAETTCKQCGSHLVYIKPEDYIVGCEFFELEPQSDILRAWQRWVSFSSDMEINRGKERPP